MEGRCGTSSLLQETRLKRLGPAPPPGCAPGVESHLGENVSLTEQVCCRPGRPATSRQAVQTLAVGLAPPFQGGVAGPSGRIRKAVVGAWQVGGAVPHVLLSLLTAGLSPATPPGPPCSRCKHFHIRQAPWSPPLTVTSGDSFCGPAPSPPFPGAPAVFWATLVIRCPGTWQNLANGTPRSISFLRFLHRHTWELTRGAGTPCPRVGCGTQPRVPAPQKWGAAVPPFSPRPSPLSWSDFSLDSRI